ncbi:DUF2922 domain-containing protein [Enterococcus nangangensis]|uniref:DUF2922 domain-containing protein n=1 Tax=Enterococcus nangangensis TaxID=2559926 RepID=UPI00148582E2|nr:DUF2922 domain-containing protein [Enterococcus nangangensis]
MAKQLKMVFLDSLGKRQTLAPKAANPTLTPLKVQTSMNAVAALELFEKDGGAKFQTPNNAYYTETIITDLF